MQLCTFDGSKAIWEEENLIWVGSVQSNSFKSVEGPLSLLRLTRHIEVVGCLI